MYPGASVLIGNLLRKSDLSKGVTKTLLDQIKEVSISEAHQHFDLTRRSMNTFVLLSLALLVGHTAANSCESLTWESTWGNGRNGRLIFDSPALIKGMDIAKSIKGYLSNQNSIAANGKDNITFTSL